MAIGDPIADMLTRIRNAVRNRSKTVTCLNSKVCRGIAAVLRDEGYIDSFDVIEDGRQGQVRIKLKYGAGGESALADWRRTVRQHEQDLALARQTGEEASAALVVAQRHLELHRSACQRATHDARLVVTIDNGGVEDVLEAREGGQHTLDRTIEHVV